MVEKLADGVGDDTCARDEKYRCMYEKKLPSSIVQCCYGFKNAKRNIKLTKINDEYNRLARMTLMPAREDS
jgi:hypothetical protein